MANDDNDGSDPTPLRPPKDLHRGFAYRGYAAAAERLLAAPVRDPGVLVLTGDAGTGKTTLIAELASRWGREGRRVERIASPRMDTEDLLRLVGLALGMGACSAAGEGQPLDAGLSDRDSSPSDTPVTLVVDDAQDLTPALLAALCNLCDSAWRRGVSLQVLLAGREGLWSLLERSEHGEIRQRILVSCRLGPVSRDEMAGYAAHALGVAGWAGDPPVGAETLALIHARTGGIPRLISLTLGHLLLNGRWTGAQAIGAADAESVLAHLAEDYPELLALSPGAAATVDPVDGHPLRVPDATGMPTVLADRICRVAGRASGLPSRVASRDVDGAKQRFPRSSGWTLGWMLTGIAVVVAVALSLQSDLESLGRGHELSLLTRVSGPTQGTGYALVAEDEKGGPMPAAEPIALVPLLAPAPLTEPQNPPAKVTDQGADIRQLVQAEQVSRPEGTAAAAIEHADQAPEDPPARGGRVAGADEPQITPAAQPVEEAQRARQSELAQRLELAERAFSADRLTVPANDNAYAHYRAALALDPGNPRARAGLSNIVTRYRVLAEAKLEKGDSRGARRLASRGLTLAPTDSELLEIKRKAREAGARRPERDAPELLARLEDWLRSGRSDRSLFLDL